MFVRIERRFCRAPIFAIFLSLCAVSLTACSDSSSTTPSVTPAIVTETFSGSIGQGETAVHSFSVANSGYSLLAGFTSISPASVTALGLGIATWDPATSTCALNMTQNDASHSGSTALNGTAGIGNYCVRVYDGGNVAAGVVASYTLQVQHY